MVFSSPIFLFLFLPIVFVFHRLIKNDIGKKSLLVLSSLIFYGWWEPLYLILIITSICVNYSFYQLIIKNENLSKSLTFMGVFFNVLLLAYFKYSYFIVDNLSFIMEGFSIEKVLLPLGISFFTFQQIAFLIDTYKKDTSKYNLLDYTLFVTFFPQLIAGPIVHHKEMMPQFESKLTARHSMLLKGLIIFSIGLFKKLIIADTFAIWADSGFANTSELSFLGAWLTTISYTVQLYYDFSGYCDMAIGLALLFNIKLPQNFNSPYKALNIKDFWARWHITLSSWLRDYIYIPLGGNRNGNVNASLNVFITFLIGGVWHGAGWNFIVWGALHGFALVVYRVWSSFKIKIHSYISWALTIIFIHFTWVFFRSETIPAAINIIKSMLSPSLSFFDSGVFASHSLNLPFLSNLNLSLSSEAIRALIQLGFLFMVLIGTITMKNSMQIARYNVEKHNFSNAFIIFYGLVFGFSSLSMFLTANSSFLYFNF